MQIRWLGTAGFELCSKDTSILIDPYLTRNSRAIPFQELGPKDFPHVKAILVTHGHFDHVYDVPELVSASEADVYASPSICRSLAMKAVPWNRLKATWAGEKFTIGPFRITALPACHVTFDPHLVASTLWHSMHVLPLLARLGPTHYPLGEVLGWIIEVDGGRMLHIGSACMSGRAVPDIDVFLVPVQGRTDICRVAADLVKRVKPDKVIPHHFDDFYPPLSRYVNLLPFEGELRRIDSQVELEVPVINRLINIFDGNDEE